MFVLQVSVLQAFENLEKIVKQHYSTDDQLIISCPSQDEVSLLKKFVIILLVS